MQHALIFPSAVFDEVVASVRKTAWGLETGVTLFGVRVDGVVARHVVLNIAGPGERATHEPAHYSGNEGYATAVYAALRTTLPGIRWIGELHVHPPGMRRLSHGDRRTVKQILTGTDDTAHPDEFIAGVMQRRTRGLDLYPVHFTRECLDGSEMAVEIVDNDAATVVEARQKAIVKGDTQ